MKLHELAFHSNDTKATKHFYHDVLGLHIDHEQEGLVVIDGGRLGIEIGANVAGPAVKGIQYISFLVEDVDALAKQLRAKGVQFEGPKDINLGKRAITLTDPDGLTVAIHSPTEKSPQWVKDSAK